MGTPGACDDDEEGAVALGNEPFAQPAVWRRWLDGPDGQGVGPGALSAAWPQPKSFNIDGRDAQDRYGASRGEAQSVYQLYQVRQANLRAADGFQKTADQIEKLRGR
jgi:hypothetical protein